MSFFETYLCKSPLKYELIKRKVFSFFTAPNMYFDNMLLSFSGKFCNCLFSLFKTIHLEETSLYGFSKDAGDMLWHDVFAKTGTCIAKEINKIRK